MLLTREAFAGGLLGEHGMKSTVGKPLMYVYRSGGTGRTITAYPEVSIKSVWYPQEVLNNATD